MLRIHTSHRTEVLLDALVYALSEERKRSGAFVPVQVVVPNGNIETYLRLGVAERLGIAANLETTFLRKFLTGLAERAVPGARVAGATVNEGHLLALLHDDNLLARADLARVRGYLLAAGAERDAVDRRRCQLAAALAQLFDEYAGSRAEMLAAWHTGGSEGEPNLEMWQRALWLEIFGAGGRLERQGKDRGARWLPLAALWDEAMRGSPTPYAGGTVHVFGLSYIATAYHRMLAQLAHKSEIHVYTLNPCREELVELRAGDELLAAEEGLHPALALWARPGRENLRRLARVAGATFAPDFPAGDATTLLHRLQADIVNRRAPDAGGAPAELDASLRVLPCPSLRRELEVVAAEIWSLLRKEPTLRACDVAVIVPEKSKDLYLAQLPAVFHESCDLPHNVADAGAAGSHRVALAIALLIELPFSTFSRRDFLPLLTHPCLMARFPSATPEGWRALAAALGIVRGADRGDFDPAYLHRDLYSWDQGLARLALGAVVDQANADSSSPLSLGGDSYLPGPPVDSDDEAALGFGLLARSLIADAGLASGRAGPRQRPLGEWLDFLRGLVGSYLVLDEDDGAGQAVVARFLAELDELAETGLGPSPVSYRVAAELAKRALAALPGGRGHYLAGGVTVASFVPMRAIPFRAVFVLGLGQDAFPRPQGHHELDLRAGQRLPGDVDGREQDLYMLLETLLSARDHLTLSYVSRDEITGDELPASAALLELRAILGDGYLGAAELARLFCDARELRPTLRRYDDEAERRRFLPAAAVERRAQELGQAVAARAGRDLGQKASGRAARRVLAPAGPRPRLVYPRARASIPAGRDHQDHARHSAPLPRRPLAGLRALCPGDARGRRRGPGRRRGRALRPGSVGALVHHAQDDDGGHFGRAGHARLAGRGCRARAPGAYRRAGGAQPGRSLSPGQRGGGESDPAWLARGAGGGSRRRPRQVPHLSLRTQLGGERRDGGGRARRALPGAELRCHHPRARGRARAPGRGHHRGRNRAVGAGRGRPCALLHDPQGCRRR